MTAREAFQAGDWAEARRLARAALADSASDEEARAAARDVLARLKPDWLVLALIGASVVFFVLVAAAGFRR